MNKYQFKTNINCSGCVATVTPHLDGAAEIKGWNVDTANPSKILTIETDTLGEEQVKKIVEGAGFKAEKIDG